MMLVEDLENALKVEFSTRDADTVAGVVLSELGRRARKGDRVELPPLSFEVLETKGNRIKTLLCTLQPPADAAAAPGP